MTSRVLPVATSILAHKRLSDLAESLEHKAGGGTYDVGLAMGTRPVVVRDTELRVLGLARAALAQVGGGERVALSSASRLGPGPGRFAVLGTAAYDLPAYGGLVSGTDHSWVGTVLRSGSPDPNRAHVLVPSGRLALSVAERAAAAGVDPKISRAFAHGMLDAVATGTLASPVLHGLHARRSTTDWRAGDPRLERAAAEHRALALFGRDGARQWTGFWPGARQVPPELLTAYLAALQEVHAFGGGRAPGFPSFDQALPSSTLPTADDLRTGYGLLRLDLALSAWSGFSWWAFVLPLWVAPSVGLILARELPGAQSFFREGELDSGAVTEVLSLATGIASVPPFVWSMLLWGAIPDRTGIFVESLLLFLARAGLTIGWAAGVNDRPGADTRLALLLSMLGLDAYALVRMIVDFAGHRPVDGFVHLLQTLPSMSGALTLGLAGVAKGMDIRSDGGFWAYWAVTTAVMLLSGIGVAASLTGSSLRGLLLGGGAGLRAADAASGLGDPAVADPAAAALTFDDSALWADGNPDRPALTDLRYPSGMRPLLKIWWTGAGAVTIVPDGHQIVLRAGGPPITVPMPRTPPTAAALAAALEAALPGLRTQVVDATVAPALPWPSTFADPGDGQPTRSGHDAHVGDRTILGTDLASAYVLRHTPRSELGSPLGVTGAAVPAAASAVPLVPQRGLGDLEQTAVGAAADLAVLLHLGAAPWLDVVPAAPRPAPAAAPANLGKAYEVFRHWNLDHRRVNEWRMLVGGGAESEKAGAPAAADPGMLAGRPAPSAAAAAGEPIATALGWVPLWRAWTRVAGDLTADGDAAVTMPYTPTARRADGSTFRPTNAELTAGVRFLLDLP